MWYFMAMVPVLLECHTGAAKARLLSARLPFLIIFFSSLIFLS